MLIIAINDDMKHQVWKKEVGNRYVLYPNGPTKRWKNEVGIEMEGLLKEVENKVP